MVLERHICAYKHAPLRDSVHLKETIKDRGANKAWLSLLTSNKPRELVKILSLICSESHSHSDQRGMVGSA